MLFSFRSSIAALLFLVISLCPSIVLPHHFPQSLSIVPHNSLRTRTTFIGCAYLAFIASTPNPELPYVTRFTSRYQSYLKSYQSYVRLPELLMLPELPQVTRVTSRYQNYLTLPELPYVTRVTSSYQSYLTIPELPHVTRVTSRYQSNLSLPVTSRYQCYISLPVTCPYQCYLTLPKLSHASRIQCQYI